jgi:hypothetical protein
MDWLIYNLVDDVIIHYWYGVQCRIFSYVGNKKQENIVINAFLWACDISDTNVPLRPDGEDIAICGIHQPHGKSVDHTCLNFKMVVMQMPPCNTSHCL